MVQRFLLIIDNISEWSGKISSFFVLAASLAVAVEVVMRYAFDAPPIWGFELSIYLCAVAYLLSGAYAELHKAHVRIDIFYMHWSPRVKAIIDLTVTTPLLLLGVGALLWFGVEKGIEDFINGTTSGTPWGPVIWPVEALLVLGCLLLIFRGIATFIRNLHTAKTGIEIAARAEEI